MLADEQVSSVSVEGDVLWALTDRMGSVRDVVDSSGQLRLHRDFDAFGNVVGETHYNASGQEVTSGTGFVTVAFAFTGRLWDDETKLQNNLNRWYDPATGSWISEDPIGFLAGDANLNRYVGNEPTGYIDPLGLQSGDDGGNGYGGGGGAGGDDWRTVLRKLGEADPQWEARWFDPSIPLPWKDWIPAGFDRAGTELFWDPKTGRYWGQGGSAGDGALGSLTEDREFLPDGAAIATDKWGTGDYAKYTAELLLLKGRSRPRGWSGYDPRVAPKGYEWRGRPGSPPGSREGSYYNPSTREVLRPDLSHPGPIGPHWDYRAPDGSWYRNFPDGSKRPK